MRDRTASILLCLLSLLGGAIVGCAILPPPQSESDRLVSLLQPAKAPATATATLETAPAKQPPRARLVHLDRACKQTGGNPILVLPDQVPSAPGSIRCTVLTTWVPPRPEVLLIVAVGFSMLQPRPFDLDGAGAPGCSLAVAWSSLLIASPKGPQDPKLRWVDSGRAELELPVRQQDAGVRVYVQAAIASTANQARLLTTAQVAEFWIPRR